MVRWTVVSEADGGDEVDEEAVAQLSELAVTLDLVPEKERRRHNIHNVAVTTSRR